MSESSLLSVTKIAVNISIAFEVAVLVRLVAVIKGGDTVWLYPILLEQLAQQNVQNLKSAIIKRVEKMEKVPKSGGPLLGSRLPSAGEQCRRVFVRRSSAGCPYVLQFSVRGWIVTCQRRFV